MHLNFAFTGKKLRYKEYLKKCKSTLKLLNIDESDDTLIGNLNFHKRVLIEIAQALICDARIIVLDSIVGLLSDTAHIEFRDLFKKLKLYGISIVIIENQADLIQRYLDRLCIMRKGRIVAELMPEEMKQNLILSLSEGESYIPRSVVIPNDVIEMSGENIFEFSHVKTEDGVIQDLSFKLCHGEILGIWNKNRHSGQAIQDILEGKTKLMSGSIQYHGKKCECNQENWSYQYGIYLLPETDRLCSNMSVGENIGLSALKKNACMKVVIKEGELKYLIQNLCEEFMGKKKFLLFPDQMVPEGQLFRKKISLCRALAANAKIIVYNNPFLRMDIKERVVFGEDLIKIQKKAVSQILISSQIETLYPLCSRIVQVDEGKNRRELGRRGKI